MTILVSSDGTTTLRTNSDQSQTMGLQRLESLKCTEAAAQLLEVKLVNRSARRGKPWERCYQDS